MHHAVHCTNANIGGSLEGVLRRKMNEPSDDAAVVNNSSEVPDQGLAKKQNEACNKRDATVLGKLKMLSVEDIILDEMKTQILSIAGVDYASLSANVRLYFLLRNGDNGAKQEEEERGNNRTHTQPCKWASTERDCEAAHEEKGKSFKDSPSSIDERWNALSDYQCNMFCRRNTAFPAYEKSHVMGYSRQWGEEHVLVQRNA